VEVNALTRRLIDTKTVRDRLGDLLDQARYRGHEFIITRRGRPLAALIPFSEYERLQRQRAEALKVFDEIWQANAGADPGRVAADVERAVAEARQARRRAARRQG